jgi:hypothetical protein
MNCENTGLRNVAEQNVAVIAIGGKQAVAKSKTAPSRSRLCKI